MCSRNPAPSVRPSPGEDSRAAVSRPLQPPPASRFRKENGGVLLSHVGLPKTAAEATPGQMLTVAATPAASGLLPSSSVLNSDEVSSSDDEEELAPQSPLAPPAPGAPLWSSAADVAAVDDEEDDEELAPQTPPTSTLLHPSDAVASLAPLLSATALAAVAPLEALPAGSPSQRLTAVVPSEVPSLPPQCNIVPEPPSMEQRAFRLSSPAVSPPRDERPWLGVSRQCRPRHGGLSDHGNSATGRFRQEQASLLRFISKTKGKCSRCLDPYHRASKCRDQMRCFSCDESGHRERFCPRRRKSKPPSCSSVGTSKLAQATSSPTAPGARSWAEIVAAPLPCEGLKDHAADVAGGYPNERQDKAVERTGCRQGPRGMHTPSPQDSSCASPPRTLSIDCTAVTVMGLRHAFAEQARCLCDDLNAALDKSLQPFKDEVAALRSWLGRTSSFLEQVEKLAARLDITSPTFAPLPRSPEEGPSPPMAVRPSSTTMGPFVIQSLVPLHGEDDSWSEGTQIAKDASPTFTSITPSCSPPSPVGSRCVLDLSLGSPYMVGDISAEFEPAPWGMPVHVSPPLPPFMSTPASKKTKCLILASPRRSGRIVQQKKKKLPFLKSKGGPKKNKKPYD
ncbi:hypothetical protein ACQ4PT_022830 [Festuca glaucescens]